jgi:hypothetical protein
MKPQSIDKPKQPLHQPPAPAPAFRRWLIANTIFGVVAVFALIALASTYSGGDSDAMTAQKQQMLIQAEAH